MPRQPRMMGPGGVEKAKDFKKSFKHLFSYIKPYLLSIILALTMTTIATVLVLVATRMLGNITSEIQLALKNNRDIDLKKISSIGIIIGCFYVINFVFHYIQNFIMTGVSQKVAYKMRQEISIKINKLPLKYYDGDSIGNILSRITNDADTISSNLSNVINQIFHSLAMLLGAIVMMFTINVPMTFIVFASIPLSALIMASIVKGSQKYFRLQQNALGAVNGQIEEMFTNHTVVKAYSLEKKSLKQFDGLNQTLYISAWKSQFFSGIIQPMMNFVGNLCYVFVAIIGGIFAIKGSLLIGDIQSFITYTKQFNQPISQLSSISSSLQNMVAANERIMEFLQEEEEPVDTNTIELPKKIKGDVEFKNVCFGYDPDKEIIHNFSASIKAGQKVAIVGPTGSGKTTLVSLLMRFYQINSGDITIDGTSIYKMKKSDVHSLFGMVLQDTWLFNGTVRENLTYGADISNEKLEEICKKAKVDHFIKSFPGGYDMVITEENAISQGQKQLLTIARAMIQNNPMLILDEATSNVDTRTEEIIQQAMDKLTEGRTSFVIAHRLSTIKNADLILVLKDGNIIEQGNHEELLKANGFYATLYNSQFTK